MFKSWRLGRVLGFPLDINLSFLLLLAFVLIAYGGLAGVFVVLLAFGGVLLHELGHAVVARHLGVHVSGIELSFFGGAAKMHDIPRTPGTEIAIAAAGPAVSVLLSGLGFGLGALFNAPLISLIGWINLVIAAFNLIPALPMDGGRILRAILALKLDFRRATDVAVIVARVFTVVFAVYGLATATYQLVLLAPFLWMMTSQEQRMSRAMEADGVEVFGRGRSRGAWNNPTPMRRFELHRTADGRVVVVPLD